MIHLDRNHSSTIARHSKPANLILSNPPHPDQHQILSWASPTRDARPYYQESQEQFLTDTPSKLSVQSDIAPIPDLSSQPSSLGPITPGDAEDPKLPEPSPSSPADPRSPPADSSSSLTPPPDASTSPVAAENADEPPGRSSVQRRAEATPETPAESGEKASEVDKASRQSTPLSELSSASDFDDVREIDSATKEDGHEVTGSPEDCPSSADASSMPEGSNEVVPSNEPVVAMKDENTSCSLKPSSSPAAFTASSPPRHPPVLPTAPDLTAKQTSADGDKPIGAVGSSSIPDPAPQKDATRPSNADMPSSSHTPASPVAVSPSGPALDPKVVSILELNSLLLRISMEFQSRGVQMNDPKYNQYAIRLQSNLTWLAAAADESHKVSPGTAPLPSLPMMQPPPPVEHASMGRIQALYSELPVVFAKEIMRRQHAAPSNAPSPSSVLNGNAKRERTEEPAAPLANKRRDTGESKAPTPIAPAPPVSAPSSSQSLPILAPQLSHSNSSMSLTGAPIARMGTPAMPPPPVPSGMMPGANEAQLAAARARQVPIRQSMQQQQQQPHAEGNRQMSPPAAPQQGGMPVQNIAGPSSMPHMSQASMLASLGPSAMQNLQLLQNQNHPFVQYLIQHVPGFMSMSVPDKLQKMQMAQAAMHARGQQQQAQRAAAQSQAGGSMSGYPQAGMQAARMSPMTDGSPTRVSPVSQQGPMQAQSPLGSFPYSGHVSNPADPRTALSGLTPQQQQAMLANMPSQQRQLLLMQQQMMRGANVGNVPNPAGMMSTPQMLAAAQERMRLDQRMSQMGSTHHAGSSMTGMEGNQFPALRSNPGVPGIARSQRTPSDSLPSPISQQRLAGQMSEDQQRAMMMQQAQQRGMTPHMQNPGFAQGGGGSLHNAGWSHGGSQQSAQMGHAQGGFSMSSPGSGGNGGSYGALPGGAPSPAGNQMWAQNAGMTQYPFMAPSPAASQHHSDNAMTPRQTSATPAPHQQMSQNSPSTDQTGLGDFDFMNWGQ